jgi:PAS domain-containing protein
MVRIDGCFRRADSAPRGRPTSGPTGLQLIRRARGRDDNIPLHSISGNDIVSEFPIFLMCPRADVFFALQILIAMARVIKPPMFFDRLIEACRYEYKTRHLIDGRIMQCDQRISIVAGYMTEEVSGLSPFTFIHRDDVRWVMVALRQSKSSDYSSGVEL